MRPKAPHETTARGTDCRRGVAKTACNESSKRERKILGQREMKKSLKREAAAASHTLACQPAQTRRFSQKAKSFNSLRLHYFGIASLVYRNARKPDDTRGYYLKSKKTKSLEFAGTHEHPTEPRRELTPSSCGFGSDPPSACRSFRPCRPPPRARVGSTPLPAPGSWPAAAAGTRA